jgi:pyruvate formate lyase activating enzyme
MERDLSRTPPKVVPESAHPGRWWHALEDERIQCDLCPRDCKLHEGQRGACFVRQNQSRPDDPDHLRPLVRLLHRPDRKEAAQPLPSRHRRFCRSAPPAATWRASSARTGTSRSRRTWTDCSMPPAPTASPRGGRLRRQSVAFTYNDPVIFAEYAIDTALACHERGIRRRRRHRRLHPPRAGARVLRRDGRRQRRPQGLHRRVLFQKLCGGHLQPVLDTSPTSITKPAAGSRSPRC